MKWGLWKIGALVSLALSLLVAGAAAASYGNWKTFCVAFCAASLTHFGAFVYQHPVDTIILNGHETTNTSSSSSAAPCGVSDARNSDPKR